MSNSTEHQINDYLQEGDERTNALNRMTRAELEVLLGQAGEQLEEEQQGLDDLHGTGIKGFVSRRVRDMRPDAVRTDAEEAVKQCKGLRDEIQTIIERKGSMEDLQTLPLLPSEHPVRTIFEGQRAEMQELIRGFKSDLADCDAMDSRLPYMPAEAIDQLIQKTDYCKKMIVWHTILEVILDSFVDKERTEELTPAEVLEKVKSAVASFGFSDATEGIVEEGFSSAWKQLSDKVGQYRR